MSDTFSSLFVRACQATAAEFVTLDFTTLTNQSGLWAKGVILTDRTHDHESIKIHSLIELEQGVQYSTACGNSLVRTSRTTALLADRVVLPVDLVDAVVSPRASLDEDELSRALALEAGEEAAEGVRNHDVVIVGSALSHVRALAAEPSAETLGALQRTLSQLSPARSSADAAWLESFLALDGVQAVLDVLSHSQHQQAIALPPPTPPHAPPPTALTSPLASPLARRLDPSPRGSGAAAAAAATAGEGFEEGELLQARCVGCLAFLIRRRAALDSLLSQPHAVTCLVAALDVRSIETQVCRLSRRGAHLTLLLLLLLLPLLPLLLLPRSAD